MLEKLKPLEGLEHSWLNKINELIDVVNALVKENNIHEKQIDELQIRTGMLEQRVKALDDPTSPTYTDTDLFEQPVDKFAEQKRWIEKLCWFSNGDGFDKVGYLTEIDPDMPGAKFRCNCQDYYEECKPVKPDDSIIYKGE